MTDAQLAAWLARVLRGRAAQSPQATARRPVAPLPDRGLTLHDHTEPGRVAEAGEAGTSDARSFARHEPPQPDDAGRALSPSAEAAGRQPFSAGFHTTPPPQNRTGAAREGGDLPKNNAAADSRANVSELCAAPGCGAERGGARHNADYANTSRAQRVGFAFVAARRECA